jgi:hypothetical protein
MKHQAVAAVGSSPQSGGVVPLLPRWSGACATWLAYSAATGAAMLEDQRETSCLRCSRALAVDDGEDLV